MTTHRWLGAVACLALSVALVACGGGSGSSTSSATSSGKPLEAVAVPAGFDFVNTKEVTFDIFWNFGDAYIKIALDPGYVDWVYLGKLGPTGSLSIDLVVPAATTTLYFKVYAPDQHPVEGTHDV